MQKLLVTGGCGFIGCNFIRHVLSLHDSRVQIINLDKLTYAGNPLSLEDIATRLPDRYTFVHGDICDPATIARVLDEYQIDTICHFAAESHVDRSIVRPDDFIHTNIIGTYNLLQAARERKDRINLFHHVSTDEVYGSLGPTGFFTETTPYHPNSPYSASKASSDHLVRAYHETYGLPVTISNCSNNYGPYQFPEKLIPLMILNAIEGKDLPVYGDGQNVRDWLFVTDHCTAIWTIMNSPNAIGGTYNIGGRCEMPNLQVVEQICDWVEKLAAPLPGGRNRRDLIRFVKDRPGHDRRYAIDCSKAEQELGWAPAESFESGLEKTVRWYIENTNWINAVRSGEYQEWVHLHYGA